MIINEIVYPGMPPDSMLLAKVTSLDQTSNCHLRRPRTPQWTRPVWIPTRMLTFTPVTSRTKLQFSHKLTEFRSQLSPTSVQFEPLNLQPIPSAAKREKTPVPLWAFDAVVYSLLLFIFVKLLL